MVRLVLRCGNEINPPFLCPAGLIPSLAGGHLFSKTNNIKKFCIYAKANKVLPCCLGSSLAEGNVVLFCCPRVTVSLNSYLSPRVLPEPFKILSQGFFSIGPDVGFVEIKVDWLKGGCWSWLRRRSWLGSWRRGRRIRVRVCLIWNDYSRRRCVYYRRRWIDIYRPRDVIRSWITWSIPRSIVWSVIRPIVRSV